MADDLTAVSRLDGCLRHLRRTKAQAPALVYARGDLAGLTLTWRELDEWADSVCSYLAARRVAAGDRCAVFLADEPAAIAAVYGVMRLGAIVVPIDPLWGVASISNILNHAEVTHAIGRGAEVLQSLSLRKLPEFSSYAMLPKHPTTTVTDRNVADEIAFLAFTSGTTSDPKGVVITHRQIRAAYNIGREALSMPRAELFGCVFRLSGLGILGACYLFAAAHGAGTIVLPELNAATAAAFWTACDDRKIDLVYLVPAVLQIINRLADPPRPGAHPTLCTVAAAPLPQEAFDTFKSRFSARLRNIYGMTELSFAILFGSAGEDGMGSMTIGKGIGVRTRLVDNDGREVDGPGEGELQIASPSASSGYWRNPEATSALFTADGWLRTGDLARRDQDGDYAIVGRIKDIVIQGGFNIHLADVDETLLSHPAVLGASAVGFPDPLYGEKVVAAVHVARDATANEGELLAWARERLGINRAPKRIFHMANGLPVNGAGKVVRRFVKAEIERLVGGTP